MQNIHCNNTPGPGRNVLHVHAHPCMCFRLVYQPWIFPLCYTNNQQLTCKSDPTGLTGHSANTAPPNSSCSQASHLLQVKLLASFRRFSQASLKWHWNCLSSQCLCLFIGWSLKFLQYLRLHFCLSDYNRFKTMAILSDNNRWKYSCREVCAQSKLRWATWEIWE